MGLVYREIRGEDAFPNIFGSQSMVLNDYEEDTIIWGDYGIPYGSVAATCFFCRGTNFGASWTGWARQYGVIDIDQDAAENTRMYRILGQNDTGALTSNTKVLWLPSPGTNVSSTSYYSGGAKAPLTPKGTLFRITCSQTTGTSTVDLEPILCVWYYPGV